MNEIIVSYLIQKGECTVPDFGTFSLHTRPAKYDVVTKEMRAPETKVHFVEKVQKTDHNFIEYICELANIDTVHALENLQKWVIHSKAKLENDGEIVFPTLGSLAAKDGNYQFENVISLPFFKAISAGRVTHKEAKHTVIVGDKESTNTEMNHYLNDPTRELPSKNRFWKVAAAVLLILGLGALAYHFYHHNTSGNQTTITPKAPENTYISR